MRRLSVPMGLFVAFSLGCGIFGKGGDDTDDTTSTDALDQSDVCADYLTCASAADPDAFSSLEETYGPDGDCWTQGQDIADNCSDACLEAVKALAVDNRTEDGCEDYAPAIVLEDGFWTLDLELNGTDDCGIGEALGDDVYPLEGEVDNDSDFLEFTWDLDDPTFGFAFALDCTVDGDTFECDSGEGSNPRMALDGDGEGDRASGSWHIAIEGSCDSDGDFTATLE